MPEELRWADGDKIWYRWTGLGNSHMHYRLEEHGQDYYAYYVGNGMWAPSNAQGERVGDAAYGGVNDGYRSIWIKVASHQQQEIPVVLI
jgi:hypothetical protein